MPIFSAEGPGPSSPPLGSAHKRSRSTASPERAPGVKKTRVNGDGDELNVELNSRRRKRRKRRTRKSPVTSESSASSSRLVARNARVIYDSSESESVTTPDEGKTRCNSTTPISTGASSVDRMPIIRKFCTETNTPPGSPETEITRLRAELSSKDALLERHQRLLTSTQQSITCQICLDVMHKPYALSPCGHLACHDCLVRWFTEPDVGPTVRRKTCPHCRALITERPVEVWGLKGIVSHVVQSGLIPNLSAPPGPPPNANADAAIWDTIFGRAPAYHAHPDHVSAGELNFIAEEAAAELMQDMGIWDPEDGGIYRCLECLHEIWEDGICSGCERQYRARTYDGENLDTDQDSNYNGFAAVPRRIWLPPGVANGIEYADFTDEEDVDDGEPQVGPNPRISAYLDEDEGGTTSLSDTEREDSDSGRRQETWARHTLRSNMNRSAADRLLTLAEVRDRHAATDVLVTSWRSMAGGEYSSDENEVGEDYLQAGPSSRHSVSPQEEEEVRARARLSHNHRTILSSDDEDHSDYENVVHRVRGSAAVARDIEGDWEEYSSASTIRQYESDRSDVDSGDHEDDYSIPGPARRFAWMFNQIEDEDNGGDDILSDS